MTDAWELLAGSLVFAWVLMQVPGLRRQFWVCHVAGVLAVAATALLGWSFGGVWIATFEPFGVLLPGVCLASCLQRAGYWAYPPITRVEKLAGTALILILVLGSLDLLSFVPYTWFYAGWPPAVLACALAIWAVVRGQMHVLICVALAQVFWLLDVGSSNFVDQVSHLLLGCGMFVSALKFRLPFGRLTGR